MPPKYTTRQEKKSNGSANGAAAENLGAKEAVGINSSAMGRRRRLSAFADKE